MRDRHAIDSELRLVAGLRSFFAERDEPMPSTEVLDRLLDERNSIDGVVG